MDTDVMSPASTLCTACGMCCDGTLFRQANMVEADRVLLAPFGLTANPAAADGKLRFKLPCPMFARCCTVYDQKRPKICAAFRCRLLKKLDANEITLPDAMDKVRMARALQSSLQASLPLAESTPLSIQEVLNVYHGIDQADKRQRQQQAVFLMVATKFIALIRDAFLPKTSKKQKAN